MVPDADGESASEYACPGQHSYDDPDCGCGLGAARCRALEEGEAPY